jgi:DNA-directed RNA polymerase sigma subunit (sigma70/sigma32)
VVDPPGLLPGRGRQGHADPPAGPRPRAPGDGSGHVGADAQGARPPAEELAEEVALAPQQFEQALAASSVVRSLNEPVDDQGSELGDLVGDECAGEEFDEVERRIDASRLLASALRELPARERHVLTRRYASEPATLSELSRDLGVCHQRVAQLEDTALSELRKIVTR